MHKKVAKTGFILSLFAVVWLVIPCSGHCDLLSLNNQKSQEKPLSHECCDTQSKSNPIPNSSDNGLKQLCISSVDSFIVPSAYHYTDYKVTVEKISVALLNNVSFANKSLHRIDNYLVTSLHYLYIEPLVANLNTPHAPPVTS